MKRQGKLHNVLKAVVFRLVFTGLSLWILLTNCVFQSIASAHVVSVIVDSPEHQFGDTVNFSVSIKTEATTPAVSDVYAVLTFPDAPLVYCGDNCEPVFTFESIGSSFGKPGNTNRLYPVVNSWHVTDLNVPFSLNMGTYPIGEYSLWVILMQPGFFDWNHLNGYGNVTFSIRSTRDALGTYPGTLLYKDPPEIPVSSDTSGLPASDHLAVPQVTASGFCHLGSIGMLLNYFGAHTNTYELWVMSGTVTCAVYDSYSKKLIPNCGDWTSGLDRNYLGNFNAPFVVTAGYHTTWGNELFEVASGKIRINDAERAKAVLKIALANGFPVMVHTDTYEFRNIVPQCANSQPGSSDFQVVTGYDEAGVTLNFTFPDNPNVPKKDLPVDWDSFLRAWNAAYQDPAIREPYWMLILTGEYKREDPSEVIAWLKYRGVNAPTAILNYADWIASGFVPPTSVDFGGFFKFRKAFAWFLKNAGRYEAAVHYEAAANIFRQLDDDYHQSRPMIPADVAAKLRQIASEESQGLEKL